MVRRDKKGQAAMEFLMTYGWAILAAIVAIGVLAYFGVFSPGRFIPSSCVLNAPFGCGDEFAITTNGIDFVLTNGAGDRVEIKSIDITTCNINTTLSTNTISGYVNISDGSTQLVSIPCTLASGAKFKGDINVTYTKGTATIEQHTTGTVTGKAS